MSMLSNKMKWLRKRWSFLSQLGDENFEGETGKKQNAIINQILLFFILQFVVVVLGVGCVNIVFAVSPSIRAQMHADLAQSAILYGAPAVVFFFFYIFLYNHRARTGQLRSLVVALFFGSLFLTYYCILLGKNVGFHYYFFVLLPIPFFVIPYERRYLIAVAAIFNITLMVLNSWWVHTFDPLFPVPPAVENGLHYALIIATAGGVLACTYSLWVQTHRTEAELISARDILNRQRVNLEAANMELSARDKMLRLELDLASNIQQAMLPTKHTEVDNLQVLRSVRPVSTVSGDYFDIFKPGKATFVLLADISGHGIPAALICMVARQAFNAAVKPALNTAAIFRAVNQALVKAILTDEFLTAFLLRFEKNTLSYTNAGHNPAIVYQAAENRFTTLDTPGLPLGNLAEASRHYEVNKIKLHPGDRIFIYTDGVVEQRNPSGEEFGVERLLEYLSSNRTDTLAMLHYGLLDSWDRFRNAEEQSDDCSLVSIEIE